MRVKAQISGLVSRLGARGAGGRRVRFRPDCPLPDRRQRYAADAAGRAVAGGRDAPDGARRVTPDEAVRMALENNLGVQADRLGPQIGTFGVAQAHAAYAPTWSR